MLPAEAAEREDHRGGKARSEAQSAHRVPHVARDYVEQRNASCVARVVLDPIDAAERDPRVTRIGRLLRMYADHREDITKVGAGDIAAGRWNPPWLA